jgi:hypothetical protein
VLAFSAAPATTVAVPVPPARPALSLVPPLTEVPATPAAAPAAPAAPAKPTTMKTSATKTSAEKTTTRKTTTTRTTAPTTTRKATPAVAPLDEELPFVVWTPKRTGDKKLLDSLADPAAARTVRRVLTAGVRAEGPVHRDRLVRAAAAAFGLSRVSDARRTALLALLPAGTVVGDFAWPGELDPAGWSFFRRQAAGSQRPLEHVAPEEIGNAMAALCRARGGLARDELYLRTVEVFGHRRRTPAQLPLLEAALAAAVVRGRVTEQPAGRFTG